MSKKVAFIASIQEQDAWETAQQLNKAGYQVYGAYTDGASHEAGEKEGISLLSIDLADRASAQSAAKAVEEKEGTLDILVLESAHHLEDKPVGSGRDYEELAKAVDLGTVGMERILTAFLPLMKKSEGKRIAFLSRTSAGIGFCEDKDDFAWHMAQAAIHNMLKVSFNELRPEGFTFRNFVTDGPKGGMSAADYILQDFSYLPEDDYIHSDENRLVRRDSLFRELSW